MPCPPEDDDDDNNDDDGNNGGGGGGYIEGVNCDDDNNEYNEMELTGANGNELEAPEGSTIKGAIHTHPDSVIVRNVITGIQEIKYPIKMFSPEDLIPFLKIAQNGNGASFSVSDTYSAIVTSQGNYMLKFSQQDESIPNSDIDNMAAEMFYRLYVQESNDKMTGFLKYLRDGLDIENIQIYEFDTWTGEVNGKYIDENGEIKSVEC